MVVFLLIVIIFILVLGPASLVELVLWLLKAALFLCACLFVLGVLAGIAQNL